MAVNLNSSFFNSMFGNTNVGSTSSLSSLLGDYASIRNGSYTKLMKSYYKMNDTDSSKVDKVEKKKDNKVLATANSDAKALSDAAKKLYTDGKNSVFNKVSKKDENGNTSTEYDKESIYKSVKAFADAYNDMIDSGQKSSNTSILIQTAGMVTNTSHNAKLLSEMGISVDSDNHLKIDEDYFKKDANMDIVKSMFSGNFSYGYTVGSKASMISNYASMNLSDGKGSYTSNGTYSVSTSDAVSYFSTRM